MRHQPGWPADSASAPSCRLRREGEHPTHSLDSAMPHLPYKSDSLQPSEALFDPFSLLLTDRVAAMPRGPGVDGASAAALRVLRYMWRDLQMPALGHEILRVVTFVGTYRDLMIARNLLQHSHRRAARSAKPLAGNTSVFTISPLRFSVSRFPL